MSKVFIEETTLTAIGDAIRGKTGKTELIAPLSMATEISSITTGGGGDIEIEPIVLTGDCSYGCAGEIAKNYLNLFGNTITTKDINKSCNMFLNNDVEEIPFDINYATPTSFYDTHDVSSMFNNCKKLKSLPKMNNCYPKTVGSIFSGCVNLKTIPEDYFDNWNYSYISNWGTYDYVQNMMFYNCYSLRSVNLRNLVINPKVYYSYSLYYNGFSHCHSLDELTDIPIYNGTTWVSNAFNSFLSNGGRVKHVIFRTNEDGSPIKVDWKQQNIDTTSWGKSHSTTYILDYNSGITADKEVKNDATYQTLKNNPDWFSRDINYSRYNHDSAVETINSLPDTSAYLATAGGTNTIKFKGEAGSLTDGGAINTMTEEEIAVATAKGWTVSFT